MTKPEQKVQIRKEIKLLEERRAERLEYLLKHPDAENYDEIAQDKRAIEVKISNNQRRLTELDSSKLENMAPCTVLIPFRYALR